MPTYFTDDVTEGQSRGRVCPRYRPVKLALKGRFFGRQDQNLSPGPGGFSPEAPEGDSMSFFKLTSWHHLSPFTGNHSEVESLIPEDQILPNCHPARLQ